MFVFTAALLLAACEVEFSPNAEYKETPVVYCLLDQDDDTVWVRVERCFLEEGNIYDYGSDPELINYPQGTISVTLSAWRNGGMVSSVLLSDTLRAHEMGLFASVPQPIYYTTEPLDTTCMYKLEVRRTDDGTLLAYTDSIPLILQTESTLITRPSNVTAFGFNESNNGTASCQIAWNRMQNARRYQPIVRFFYGENGDTLHVDLPCNSVVNPPFTTSYSRNSFLYGIKEALKDDPAPKTYLKFVEIYLTACDENLNVYLRSVASGTSMNQTSDTYTNIHGGMGIFAARRIHLYKYLRADSSMNPLNSGNPGLLAYLQDLGVGF